MADKRIFRQAALDRLASPEQLDHLVPAADARGWLALAVCALLALAVLAWSVTGSLVTTLPAGGVLTAADGGVAVLLVPAASAQAVRPGMEVVLRPAHVARDSAARVRGVVGRVERADPARYAVYVRLGPHPYSPGTLFDGQIVLARQRPIALLVPARTAP